MSRDEKPGEETRACADEAQEVVAPTCEHAETGAGRSCPPRTAAQRRAAADERHRAAGRVRFSAWLPAECIKALDRLAAQYAEDRGTVVEVAVHLMAMHVGAGLDRIELPTWSPSGEPLPGGGHASVAISIEASAVDEIVTAARGVGVTKRAEAVRHSVLCLRGLLRSGQARFKPTGGL